jgi:hypothetical protein
MFSINFHLLNSLPRAKVIVLTVPFCNFEINFIIIFVIFSDLLFLVAKGIVVFDHISAKVIIDFYEVY